MPDPAKPLSASPQWQEFWGKDLKANGIACRPAEKVLDNSEDLSKKVYKRLTAEEKRLIEHADADSLATLLSNYLRAAKGQRDKHEEDSRSLARAGNKAVRFATNFSSFLQAYSGIVEIMKGADQQYGGLAYGTLSLTLIIAVNKQQKEEHIDSALLVLQREFSRLEILRDIHSSNVMKGYIAEAYRLGIDFAREVTRYYSRSTYHRIREAITKPPQLGVDVKIAAITSAMSEIAKERAVLDSRRLHEVQQSLNEVRYVIRDVEVDVDHIKVGVEDSHVHNQNALLNTLKGHLLPDGYDPRRALEQYSSDVKQAFENPGRLRLLNIDEFKEEAAFDCWEKSAKSHILLLRGSTVVTTVDFSWLSPAVLHLIDQYRAKDRLVVSYCCHDRVHMEKDTPLHVVLSSLIYQLLEAKASILQDRPRFEELKQKFSDPKWRANTATLPFAILKELLTMFEEVYIMLDRIDRIKGDADRFINPLVRMVAESKCKLKVLLVASSNPHNLSGEKLTRDVVKEELGPKHFSTMTLDQR